MRRTFILGSCLAMFAIVAACSGSPTAPSSAGGTTIAGTVSVNGASVISDVAPGLTVSVGGTGLTDVVRSSGYFQLSGVPSGDVQLQFRNANLNAGVQVPNVGEAQFIEIVVQLNGVTAAIVNEVRSNSKVSLCHREGNGSYHLIEVSDSAEAAHRAHGDGKVGEPVPGDSSKVFDANCRLSGPAIQIKKSTNGQDADQAPGPTVAVGAAVTWTYVVTNTGTVSLTGIAVTDDRGVTVSCPRTSLNAGESMTCTGSGVAVAGQYRNIGTATASSTSGSVNSSDPSHYFGGVGAPGPEQGQKVALCHRTGNGRYQPIEVSINAEPAHRAHGDGKIGEAVPDMPGRTFGPGCSVS